MVFASISPEEADIDMESTMPPDEMPHLLKASALPSAHASLVSLVETATALSDDEDDPYNDNTPVTGKQC